MFKVITERIATKVTIMVNIILLVVIAAGACLIITNLNKGLEEQLLKRGKIESIIGAKIIARIIEEAVDNGVFSIQDAFDREYQPIPGFEPKKYHTKYDFYLDKSILDIQDEFLKDKSVIYAAAVDINGYVPTHNSKYNKPPTGNKKKDLLGNRTKRIFNDPVGIKTARNKKEGFLQIYQRDAGGTMWDISSPIYVRGKHWGGFRIGYSLNDINTVKKKLTLQLIVIMCLILLVSFIAVLIIVNKYLAPISILTKISSNLANGDIDQKIDISSNDEIGKLADVLERLRDSLKVAIDRIKR